MNRRQLFWIWLPLLVLALPLGVGSCHPASPSAPCPDPNLADPEVTDAGSSPSPDADTDGGGGVEAYAEPFDQPTGYTAPRCAAACANLQAKRCPESVTRKGEDTCYIVCKRAESTGKIDFKTDCVARASSQAAIRACGTYRCGAK